MPTSTITSKGQLTMPKAIRDALGVRPGDRVTFRQGDDGRITVEAATVDLRSLRGMLRDAVNPPGRSMSLAEIEEAIGRGAVAGAALGRTRRGRPKRNG